MQTTNEALIAELQLITDRVIEVARKYKDLDKELLEFRNSPGEWSLLECLEHLNRYGDFYLPEIEKRVISAKKQASGGIFRPGWLGNYFANLMRGKNGKITKMKSPIDKNPAQEVLSVTTIDRFIKQQEYLKPLLLQAKNIDLTHTKAAISLSRFIRLRLGDTLRFYVYHIERHIAQAERVARQARETLAARNLVP